MEEEENMDDLFPLPPSSLLPHPVQQIIRKLHKEEGIADKHDFFNQVRDQCKEEGVDFPSGNWLKTHLKILGLPVEVEETCSTGDCGPMAVVKQLRLLPDQTADEKMVTSTAIRKRTDELRRLIGNYMRFSPDAWVEEYRQSYDALDHIASRLKGQPRWANFQEMWAGMATPGIWVEEGFWTGVARVLERDVHLISMTATPWRPFQTFTGVRDENRENRLQEAKMPIYIGYEPPKHYVSLKQFPFAPVQMITIIRAFNKLNKKKEQLLLEAQLRGEVTREENTTER